MKKLMFAVLAFAPFFAAAQTAKVSGEISNPTGDWVYLQYYEVKEKKRELIILDSVKLEDGKFAMEIQLKEFMEVQFNDGNEIAHIYIEPGNDLKLKLNTAFFDETLRFKGKGSDLNNAMASYFLVNETMTMDMYQNMWHLDAKDTADAMKKINGIGEDLKSYITTLQADFPKMKENLDEKLAQVDATLARMPKSMKQSIEFQQMEDRVVGQQFAEAVGVDLAGKEAKISDYYGKPLVLDFWATWCGPCMYEMPFMTPIEEDFHDQVTILAVNVWDDQKKWEEKAPELGFANNIFLDKEAAQALGKEYMIIGIPRYMLLDKDGKIVSINAQRPSGELRQQLDDYLKSL